MFKLLCQPFELGSMTLKNRMVMPPMVVSYATLDGYTTDRNIAYYEARAKGGAGLIIQEATYIHPLGQILGNEQGISDDKYIPGLKKLTQAIHRYGAKIAVQLIHGGRAAYLPEGVQPLGPSPIAAPGKALPKELTVGEIAEIVQYFAEAAVRAKQAGYDGIEIHAAHNYLIDQFISPASNHRNDKYGGSVENRTRFLVEIIRTVRESVGDGFPVWCRMNGKEYGVKGGETLGDAKKVARLAQKAGAIAIHVSAAGPASPINMTAPVFTPALIAKLAAGIKASVQVPVIAVGRMTPEAGEELLSQGKADLIAFGRALLADPELPNKVCAGHPEQIRHCILCFRCRQDLLAKPAPGVGCGINITTGHETSFQITDTGKSKRVLVVGGGPAGMEAARVAASRGHHVILWEKESELGGQLKAASSAPHKDRVGATIPYYLNELKRLGVEVKTTIEVTPAKIIESAADAVVIATGAKPSVPQIPGLENANPVQAIDVLVGKVKVGENVVIIGGELVASEVAEFMAAQGKKVTMLRRGKEIAQKVNPVLRGSLLERLKKAGVKMLTGVSYQKATAQSLVITTKEGKKQTLNADTIILAAGAVPEKTLYADLKDKLAEIYHIGDSVSPRNLRDAIDEGFKAGLKI
jgi:2,4-dienoyl-CoA reductase-like NADH-dependent reductase (Old Yellow Enzyme family)/thioredoxin reductase